MTSSGITAGALLVMSCSLCAPHMTWGEARPLAMTAAAIAVVLLIVEVFK